MVAAEMSAAFLYLSRDFYRYLNMRRSVFFICFILLYELGFSQSANRFAEVDSFAQHFPMKISAASDMKVFISEMSRIYKTDEEKLRAVYFWITENITYDCAAYHNESPRSANPDYVLKSHKAVCSGYAALLQFCCDEMKIPCKTIRGVARGGEEDFFINPDSLKTNHSWNAVMLNGEWKLIDATWASGYADKAVTKFTKKRDEHYYFMSPAKLIYTHLPDETNWQLLKDSIVTQNAFCNQPLVMSGYFTTEIESTEPFVLVLRKNIGDTIAFKFRTKAMLKDILVFSDDKPAINLSDSLLKKDSFYYYNYVVKHAGKYDLKIALSEAGNNNNSNNSDDHSIYSALMYRLEVEDQKQRFHKTR